MSIEEIPIASIPIEKIKYNKSNTIPIVIFQSILLMRLRLGARGFL